MTAAATNELPEGFEALERWAKIWGALGSQNERYLQRQSSSLPELRDYYDAITPRLNEIFDHLDKFALESLPEPEALLFRTALGLTEVGMAVEVFGQAGVPHVPFPPKMGIGREWCRERVC